MKSNFHTNFNCIYRGAVRRMRLLHKEIPTVAANRRKLLQDVNTVGTISIGLNMIHFAKRHHQSYSTTWRF